jgi:hypothetical protein
MPLDPSLILGGQTPQPQNPLQTIGAIASLKNQQQEAQLRGVQLQGAQQENQNRQMAMDQTAALNQAYSGAISPDGSIDTGKLTDALSKSGHGSAIPSVLKGVQDYQKSAADVSTARTKAAQDQANFFGGIGSTLVQANGDPLLARTLIQHAVKQGAIDPANGNQFLQQIDTALAQDPTGATARASTLKLAQQAVAQSPEQRELAIKKQTSDSTATRAQAAADTAATGQQKLAIETPKLQADSDLAIVKDAGQKLSAARSVSDYAKSWPTDPAQQQKLISQGFTPPDQVKNARDVMAATKTAGDLTKTAHERTDEAQGAQRVGIEQARLDVEKAADAAGAHLTPAAMEQAAQLYEKTGTLPPLGMGKQGAGVRTQIMNRGADIAPGADIGSNKASYGADKSSLGKLQVSRDTVGAFENTAGKNLDLFIDSAKKLVDTGSPLLNQPLRALSGRVLGSDEQAAANAARQVATTEIAKITNNPSLSGQLSDSARHEIQSFNPESATLGQTLAVAKILKQDMANRRTSLDDAITEVKGRIGGGPGHAQVTHRYNPSTGQIEEVKH